MKGGEGVGSDTDNLLSLEGDLANVTPLNLTFLEERNIRSANTTPPALSLRQTHDHNTCICPVDHSLHK